LIFFGLTGLEKPNLNVTERFSLNVTGTFALQSI